MNGSRLKTAAILVVALCLLAANAQACGELMLRSLGAMRYHAFVTKHPAQILLYAGEAAAADKRPGATEARLHDSLERVGHKVSLAHGHGELGQALTTHQYDVIIAYADDMAGATTQIAKASREPMLIPVLDPASNEQQMRERFPRLVTGNFNDLLKAIEQAMSPSKA